MRRWIRAIPAALLKPFWRLSGPVRRPLAHKFDGRIHKIVDQSLAVALATPNVRLEAICSALGRIEESVNIGRHTVEHQNSDANLLLDGMIREVARLQMQIEALREAVDDASSHGTLGVVADDETGAERRAV